MHDYLRTILSEEEVFSMSMLALAHVGDAVYDLLIRCHEASRGITTVKTLHRNTIARVSAAAQASAAERILPSLTEREADIFRRGRNTKINSHPKHASLADYHTATAFECLFGYLDLIGAHERINELFDIICTVA